MFNAVIIGCGAISDIHIKAIEKLDNVKLYGLVDINVEKVNALSIQHNCKAFYNYIDALNDSEIDVVHICTPHYLHSQMAIDALRADKNVVLEKPLAISMKDAYEVIKTAEVSGKMLGVCFQNRYNTTSLKIKELLSSGIVGKVKGAKAFVTWHRNADYYTSSGWRGKWATEGGGVLINQSIHTIDLLLWFLGDVTHFSGKISTRLLNDFIEVENTAEALISFKDDVNALFYATTCYCDDSPVEIEILCEKARIKLSNNLVITYNDGSSEESSDIDLNTGGKSYWGSSHLSLISDFYDCLANKRPFDIPGEEAIKALSVVLGIYEESNFARTL